jgi:hypothetical protein
VAEVNKAFREALIHPNATHIWKRARLHTRLLPPPYPGFTEFEWARRVYGPERQFCQVSETIPLYFMNAKLCSGMWQIQAITAAQILFRIQASALPHMSQKMVIEDLSFIIIRCSISI